MARILEMFEVLGHRDQTEGRGGMYVVGYAFDRESANRMAAGKGVYGAPGEINHMRAVMLADGAVYTLGHRVDEEWQRMHAAARARAKLSPEDLRALGLERGR